MRKTYSTAEVAEAVGITTRTLYRWLYAAKIDEPKRQRLAGIDFRVWTEQGLKAVKEYREKNYRKRS